MSYISLLTGCCQAPGIFRLLLAVVHGYPQKTASQAKAGKKAGQNKHFAKLNCLPWEHERGHRFLLERALDSMSRHMSKAHPPELTEFMDKKLTGGSHV